MKVKRGRHGDLGSEYFVPPWFGKLLNQNRAGNSIDSGETKARKIYEAELSSSFKSRFIGALREMITEDAYLKAFSMFNEAHIARSSSEVFGERFYNRLSFSLHIALRKVPAMVYDGKMNLEEMRAKANPGMLIGEKFKAESVISLRDFTYNSVPKKHKYMVNDALPSFSESVGMHKEFKELLRLDYEYLSGYLNLEAIDRRALLGIVEAMLYNYAYTRTESVREPGR
ncbi:MAG: hypothetical protein KGH61_04770 [Candidatus Micrarchaeota archaeon]|nr:hypothetical protein [Candidatus Micrarchaeota archaeon]MDE1848230.1 hypothetical protein [Candidatus Micrarchaeota archaeon]MDE1864883.1 hypothetical protein [Candidatus Micrarchaeota archaeon]